MKRNWTCREYNRAGRLGSSGAGMFAPFYSLIGCSKFTYEYPLTLGLVIVRDFTRKGFARVHKNIQWRTSPASRILNLKRVVPRDNCSPLGSSLTEHLFCFAHSCTDRTSLERTSQEVEALRARRKCRVHATRWFRRTVVQSKGVYAVAVDTSEMFRRLAACVRVENRTHVAYRGGCLLAFL